jgi:hypothetical protein
MIYKKKIQRKGIFFLEITMFHNLTMKLSIMYFGITNATLLNAFSWKEEEKKAFVISSTIFSFCSQIGLAYL